MENSSLTNSDISVRIGRRIRGLRTGAGMTLELLATQSGVSTSMLSVIERGESSPTAVVLEKIATGLNVSLASLFDDVDASANPISRRDERVTWQDPQSGYQRANISPANFPSPIQIVEVTMPAGATVAYETGARNVTIHQQIWVQEGEIEVSVGHVTYQLAQDDCLAMQLNVPTRFHNPTSSAARYYVILVKGL